MRAAASIPKSPSRPRSGRQLPGPDRLQFAVERLRIWKDGLDVMNAGTSITGKFTTLFTLLFAALSLSIPPQVHAANGTLSGDKIPTSDGDLIIHPVEHATLVMAWNGKTICVDPVGGANRFQEFPRPDLILITDIHPDHLNPNTVAGILGPNTAVVVPQAVADKLPENVKSKAVIMANGDSKTVAGIEIEALPMYNLTPARKMYHTKGRGNGYVLTLGGK